MPNSPVSNPLHLSALRLPAIAMLAACLALPVPAQSGRRINKHTPPPRVEPTPPTVTIRTEEVFLNISVRDSLGQAVDGLQAGDFFIYDNGRRYEPLHFERRHVPVHLVLLLDDRIGQFANPEIIRQALLSFRQLLDPGDRLAVMRFSDELELTQDWGNDGVRLARAMQIRSRSGDKAAIYDALVMAAAKLHEVAGRRVIVLLTSGLNTAGMTGFNDALAAVQNAGASVYAFSQTEAIAAALRQQRPNARQDPASISTLAAAERDLTALAEQSGGMIYFPVREESLRWMLAQVADDLRVQYLITYQPQTDWLFATHRIDVLVRGSHKAYARLADPNRKPDLESHLPGEPRIRLIPEPGRNLLGKVASSR